LGERSDEKKGGGSSEDTWVPGGVLRRKEINITAVRRGGGSLREVRKEKAERGKRETILKESFKKIRERTKRGPQKRKQLL